MALRFAEKTVVLGVTGSIAAYKACDIASRLVEAGAVVLPVLTRNAREFAGPTSFEALTGNRCITEMFDPLPSPEIEHIAVAERAGLFLIAPASANILAKAAHGLAGDWLSTALLATRAPILFAPAMNTNMYEHPATQQNIAILRERGCRFAGPASGSLACGSAGLGRLIETPAILDAADIALCQQKDLEGQHVLITSGPTREAIDPVRFIANHSSGKMGTAIALEALRRGAHVTVVSGPADVAPPHGAETVAVVSAEEMFDAVKERLDRLDVFVAAAAVADYRAEAPHAEKIKRSSDALSLTFVPNPDIAAYVASHKRPGQITVGFAAETHDALAHAAEKRARKGLDVIVANQVGGEACAFGAEEVRAAVIAAENPPAQLEGLSKRELAAKLFDTVLPLLGETPE